MKVVVIGSINGTQHDMEAAVKFFERFEGIETVSALDLQDRPLIYTQRVMVQRIKEADLIVVVPKNRVCSDLPNETIYEVEFGESTSYEIAMAREFRKEIVVW